MDTNTVTRKDFLRMTGLGALGILLFGKSTLTAHAASSTVVTDNLVKSYENELNDIGDRIDNVHDRIDTEVSDINDELGNVQDRIDTEVSDLNDTIDANQSTMNTTLSQMQSRLNRLRDSTVTTVTLVAGNWSGSTAPYSYDLSNTFPNDTYNISIGSYTGTTDAMEKALSKAKIRGDANYNILHAYGTKPTINIDVMVVKTPKPL